ncbi:hypothetical protein [Ekhidna sp.]|uniref:hypothetical protein n=1 Tax=Ekhidna sp. TaxID=2608089 RepID=UPI0032EB5F78
MGALNVSDKTLKKYFTFLNKLDDSSKTRLIDRKKSISGSKKSVPSISDIYGSWEDSLSAEEQIKEIRNSRIDRSSELNFE